MKNHQATMALLTSLPNTPFEIQEEDEMRKECMSVPSHSGFQEQASARALETVSQQTVMKTSSSSHVEKKDKSSSSKHAYKDAKSSKSSKRSSKGSSKAEVHSGAGVSQLEGRPPSPTPQANPHSSLVLPGSRPAPQLDMPALVSAIMQRSNPSWTSLDHKLRVWDNQKIV